MKFSPAATKASRILNDVASSAVQPNTFPPSISGATSIPDLPISRFFIMQSPTSILAGLDDAGIFQGLANHHASLFSPNPPPQDPKTPPCFQDGVVAISAFLLREFPIRHGRSWPHARNLHPVRCR